MNLRPPSSVPLLRWLRTLAALLAVCWPGAQVAAQTEEELAQAVISMMEHVSVDYPYLLRDGQILDTAEYQGLHEIASQSVALLERLPARPGVPELAERARLVRARIDAQAPAPEVAGPARQLARDLMRIYRLTIAPRQTPNLRRAQALFQQECAVCHGSTGRGDGPAARTLQPPPGDFLDRERMSPQSILALYEAITMGLQGQSGHGAHLPYADRWSLAFLVSSLHVPAEAVRRGEALWREGDWQAQLPDLRALVLQSPADAQQRGGSALDAVRAFLTLHPEVLETSRPAALVLVRTRLREAVSAYARGEVGLARELAASASTEGFDTIAARLERVDPALRDETGRELAALRTAIDQRQRAGVVAAHAARLEVQLDRAAELLARGGMAARAVFVSALLILLREGTEAILVFAAVLAVVRKTGRPEAMRYIHAGWIAAAVLGVGTWFAAGELIDLAGQERRELAEGVSTLLAAAMLLYVGWWLHKRAQLAAWDAYIRERVAAALGGRTLWAMAGAAFLALYRELLEIVLLYRVLWVQAGGEAQRALLAGLSAGAVLLGLLALLIVRYGSRLPIGRFHAATSALLVLMALVFVGHGISALQEAHALPFTAVRFVAVPVLGIHPSAQGLAAQALVAALIVAGLLAGRRRQP
jgi:high-affinity iron transporter